MSIFTATLSKPLKLDDRYRFSHDLPAQSVPVAITDAECLERNRESHSERTTAKQEFADAETALAAAKEAHKKAKAAHDTAIAKADTKQAQAATATKPIESAVAVYAFYPDDGDPDWVQVRTDPGYEGVEHGERVRLTEKEMRKLSQQPLPLQDTPAIASEAPRNVVLDITGVTPTLVPDPGATTDADLALLIRTVLLERGPLSGAKLWRTIKEDVGTRTRSHVEGVLIAGKEAGTIQFTSKKWQAVVPMLAIGTQITEELDKGPRTVPELADAMDALDLEVGIVLDVLSTEGTVVSNEGCWSLA